MRTIHLSQQALRLTCIVLLFCLIFLPFHAVVASSEDAPQVLTKGLVDARLSWQTQEDIFLDELAKDTWNYLHSDWATDNHLPWSWRAASVAQGDYANVTEIGFYALSWIAAYDTQRSWSPTWTTTEAEVTAVLNQLRAWQTGSQA